MRNRGEMDHAETFPELKQAILGKALSGELPAEPDMRLAEAL